MKRTLIIGTVILAIGTGSLLLSGCAGTRIKQLSGDEFQKQAQQCNLMGSFAGTFYIGRSYQNAYLEYGHPAFIGKGMSTTVYWTPLSELPTNVVTQMKSGRLPWANWMDNFPAPTKPGTVKEEEYIAPNSPRVFYPPFRQKASPTNSPSK